MAVAGAAQGRAVGACRGRAGREGCEFYNSRFVPNAFGPALLAFVIDNWYLFVMAIASGLMLLWPTISGGAGGARVTIAQAVQLINREKAVLIDVCEPAEYAAGHAAGAKSIPLGTLGKSGDLPKNKAQPIVVVCASGARATRAVPTLRKLGFENVHVLAGGLGAWREANLPVDKTA
jgi:rhodanese-related sulfurtransferase